MFSSHVPVWHWSLLVLQSRAAPVQVPAWQASLTVQKRPSVHEEPLRSLAVQALAVSSHDSAQSASPSGPGQGSPVCNERAPAEQESVPVQKRSSVHAEPSVSLAVQALAVSSHDSAQSASPSGPGQGAPVCNEQPPAQHHSPPPHN